MVPASSRLTTPCVLLFPGLLANVREQRPFTSGARLRRLWNGNEHLLATNPSFFSASRRSSTRVGERMRIFKDDEDRAGQTFSESVVCGPHSRYFVLDTSRSSPAVGIHFRPGGALPFLGAAHELRDRHVALGDLWGARASQLQERVREASSLERMFRELEDALLTRLRKPYLMHPAVAYAVRRLSDTPKVTRVGQVQNETGYCAKRFIELFSGAVALTPKVYLRILRQAARGLAIGLVSCLNLVDEKGFEPAASSLQARKNLS